MVREDHTADLKQTGFLGSRVRANGSLALQCTTASEWQKAPGRRTEIRLDQFCKALAVETEVWKGTDGSGADSGGVELRRRARK